MLFPELDLTKMRVASLPEIALLIERRGFRPTEWEPLRRKAEHALDVDEEVFWRWRALPSWQRTRAAQVLKERERLAWETLRMASGHMVEALREAVAGPALVFRHGRARPPAAEIMEALRDVLAHTETEEGPEHGSRGLLGRLAVRLREAVRDRLRPLLESEAFPRREVEAEVDRDVGVVLQRMETLLRREIVRDLIGQWRAAVREALLRNGLPLDLIPLKSGGPRVREREPDWEEDTTERVLRGALAAAMVGVPEEMQCRCLVIDEAHRMSVVEAWLAARLVKPAGFAVVAGDFLQNLSPWRGVRSDEDWAELLRPFGGRPKVRRLKKVYRASASVADFFRFLVSEAGESVPEAPGGVPVQVVLVASAAGRAARGHVTEYLSAFSWETCAVVALSPRDYEPARKLAEAVQERFNPDGTGPQRVIAATAAAAAGTEFDAVVVVGAERLADGEADRRLLYGAVGRARWGAIVLATRESELIRYLRSRHGQAAARVS
jgi:hypothetical protein